MSLTKLSLKHPFAVAVAAILLLVLGVVSVFTTAQDLFPESAPPQVMVVTVQPGGIAKDMVDAVTSLIEGEIASVSGLKNITSTTGDGISNVRAEFEYGKDIDVAATEIQNVLARIANQLPSSVGEPEIYKITEASRPIATLAISPKEGSPKTLSEIRLIAENQIRDELPGLSGVADVEIFGGHRAAIEVRVDRDRLKSNNLSLAHVVSAIGGKNLKIPSGTLYTERGEYLFSVNGEYKDLSSIRNTVIAERSSGVILLSHIASVTYGEMERRSSYHGNDREAIAVNVLREDNGNTVKAIKEFKAYLPQLKQRYSDLNFEITDDQEPLIKINIKGMYLSLLQAVLLTVLVIFLFLADTRAAAVSSLSIPLSFLFSFVVLKMSPYTLNMVTLSGLIVSVGMVVDASIVVLENIYRRAGAKKGSIQDAAEEGAGEVALAITAGMMTTVVVLFPIMWAGGYSEEVMKPLIIMVISTLAASLVIAQTLIPLASKKVLSIGKKKKNVLERGVSRVDLLLSRLTSFYLAILKKCLRKPVLTLAVFALFFVLTIRTVPAFLGSELMPPMDTGIVTIVFDTPYYFTPQKAEEVLQKVEKMVYSQIGVEMVSSVLGAEPGLVSFNGGSNAQSGTLTVNLVDRTRREKTIWQIEEEWRDAISQIEGVRSFRISEYGATPLATTKAPLDIIISGPDSQVLDSLAEDTINRLHGVKGITDVRRSWRFEKEEKEIMPDPYLASYYDTSVQKISQEVSAALNGVRAGSLRLDNFDSIPIEVKYASVYLDKIPDVEDIYISTKFGSLPLKTLAEVSTSWDQPLITREDLKNTIDITAVNTVYRISQVAEVVSDRIKDIEIPRGYSISVSGTVEAMDENKKGIGRSLIFGLVLLYVLLAAMFNSFVHPLTIMSVIPLAIAGGLWGLFLLDKPLCMPATMGFILLGGTVVNNSILILDFIIEARRRGAPKYLAIIRSVELRTRPILMTAISTVVGMTPLVLESAVGLERMSPLGIVAVFGLTLGTFLTMIFLPVFYAILDNLVSSGRTGRQE